MNLDLTEEQRALKTAVIGIIYEFFLKGVG